MSGRNTTETTTTAATTGIRSSNNTGGSTPSCSSSVYDEAIDMLTGALLIYVFADLREMARKTRESKTLEEASSLELISIDPDELEPPLTMSNTMHLIEKYKSGLIERSERENEIVEHEKEKKKDCLDYESIMQRLETFHRLRRVKNRHATTNDNNANLLGQSQSLVLTNFDDSRCNTDCVYAVVVNHTLRRITLVFRGSVTTQDFVQDAKCAQMKVPNPIFDTNNSQDDENDNHIGKKDLPKTIRVHTGFYQYLFAEEDGECETGADDDDDGEKKGDEKTKTKTTRYGKIMGQVHEQMKLHPQYKLYVTGHSLGGALATLMGFYIAAQQASGQASAASSPVMIYSIASPYVGNWKFRQTFTFLERCGKIQHLRISNLEDAVSLMPFAVPNVAALSPLLSLITGSAGNLYKHVGIRFQLTSLSSCESSRGDTKSTRKEKSTRSSSSRGVEEEEEEDDDDDDEKHDDIVTGTLSHPDGGGSGTCGVQEDDEQKASSSTSSNYKLGLSLASAMYHGIVRQDFDKVQTYHSCTEYERRLERSRNKLEGYQTLSDMYHDPKIVGTDFLIDTATASKAEAETTKSSENKDGVKDQKEGTQQEASSSTITSLFKRTFGRSSGKQSDDNRNEQEQQGGPRDNDSPTSNTTTNEEEEQQPGQASATNKVDDGGDVGIEVEATETAEVGTATTDADDAATAKVQQQQRKGFRGMFNFRQRRGGGGGDDDDAHKTSPSDDTGGGGGGGEQVTITTASTAKGIAPLSATAI